MSPLIYCLSILYEYTTLHHFYHISLPSFSWVSSFCEHPLSSALSLYCYFPSVELHSIPCTLLYWEQTTHFDFKHHILCFHIECQIWFCASQFRLMLHEDKTDSTQDERDYESWGQGGKMLWFEGGLYLSTKTSHIEIWYLLKGMRGLKLAV